MHLIRSSVKFGRVKQWGATLLRFALVQALVQLVTALSGLIVVRALPKPEYALLAIANSMQSACQALAELGTGIGVRAIGGRIWNDPIRFGQLLRTSLSLRRWFAVIAFSIALPITGWLLWRNGAAGPVAVALCLAIVVSLIPLLGATTWAVSAQLRGEYRRIQKLDLGSAGIRLALLALLSLSYLNSLLALLICAVTNWVQALNLRKWAQPEAEAASPVNLGDRSALLRLSLKCLPNTIFFCFQGQVLILILTIVGSPTSIADFMALGRLAIIFQVFSITFTNVLAPGFARCQEPLRLQRLYVIFAGGMMLALALLAACAWLWPSPFLWLLGGQYASLGRECGWVVTAGCVGQIGSVMWTLNSSRAWIRVQAPTFIVSILAVQAGAALLLDLRQFHDVLLFNLLTAAAPIPVYIADAVVGLRTAHSSNDRYLNSQRLAC